MNAKDDDYKELEDLSKLDTDIINKKLLKMNLEERNKILDNKILKQRQSIEVMNLLIKKKSALDQNEKQYKKYMNFILGRKKNDVTDYDNMLKAANNVYQFIKLEK